MTTDDDVPDIDPSSSSSSSSSPSRQPPWPEDDRTRRTGPFSAAWERWTFRYMDRILRKGRDQKRRDPSSRLRRSDLYRVPRSADAERLSVRFATSLRRGAPGPDGARGRAGRGGGGGAASRGPFYRSAWETVSATFVPAGYWQLVAIMSQVSIPMVVQKILLILESDDPKTIRRHGIPYSFLLFVCYTIGAFGNHRHHFLSFQSGVILRSAVVGTVYRHALHLDPAGRSGLTSGEITNLVGVDAQKLFETMQEAHLIWSMPLATAAVSFLLVWVMGPTTLIGASVLVGFVPLVKAVVSSMVRIRRARVSVGDERVEAAAAMLSGMRVTKLNRLEPRFVGRILSARSREVALARRQASTWAWTLVLTVVSPVLAAAATFAAYALAGGGVVTTSDAFAVLLLFSALRFPINYAGKLVGKAAEGYQASQRIATFLSRSCLKESPERAAKSMEDGSKKGSDDDDGGDVEGIRVTKGCFVVGGPGSFALTDISLSVKPGETLAVVGPVGSGKSSLINAILGEISPAPHSPASVEIRGDGAIGYAPQVPFVLNASLRDNVTFGRRYEKERYDSVLRACRLEPDLRALGPKGDLTEIGERGVTLSGGQKQRISLARAVYCRPNVALFDDPLSALDADTGRAVFANLFSSCRNDGNGDRGTDDGGRKDGDADDRSLLASTAVVLVTHAVHFLHKVDRILVMDKGRVAFYGTWTEFSNVVESSEDGSEEAAFAGLSRSVQECLKEPEDVDKEHECAESPTTPKDDECRKDLALPSPSHPESIHDNDGNLMTTEERKYGVSSIQTWIVWFRHAGGWSYILILFVLLFIDRGSYVATEWWLAKWTMAENSEIDTIFGTFPPQTDGKSAQYRYLTVYAIILLVSIVSTSLRSHWVVSGGVRCSEVLFRKMLHRVVRAPMSYFETTPLGRVLNRFTYDVEVLDETLTQSMTITLIAVSWFVAGLAVMISILPYVILAIVPVTVLYFRLQLYYRKTAVDLQRLDAVSRSPIQASLAEGLDGAAVIRTFGRCEFFLSKFHGFLNDNGSAMLNFISAHRWLALRIEVLGSFVSLVAGSTVVVFYDGLRTDPAFVAMLLVWASNFTITLGFLVDSVSESEAAITSIERIYAMSQLPQERELLTVESNKPENFSSWPSAGKLEFQNVHMRYRKGLPYALRDLTFTVQPGTRCGVVGRTGAGKSSLVAALFRLAEIESGSVRLDGVDLSLLGLDDVRGRMSVIPQDPVLFAGPLRDCVDPRGARSDAEVRDALDAVRLYGSRLDDPVDERGANLSAGERQLVCLARAAADRPRVLVMDEATASVDAETDGFVRGMLRERFRDATVVTVAHRLRTVADHDVVLVMDRGRCAEFGPPFELLNKGTEGDRDGNPSLFARLVDSTGAESAAELRKIAEEAYYSSKRTNDGSS